MPVSGLLALTARTLRQSEFVALQKLAGVEAAELAKAMLSVDRFVREDTSLPVDAATRAALLDRFGMFGIRISIAVLRAGVGDSVALADELLERSGLVALRDVIDQQFAQRSDLLKAHTALLSLRQFVRRNPVYANAADPRRHRPLAGRHARVRGTAAAQPAAFSPDHTQRGRDGLAAPADRRVGNRRGQPSRPVSPTTPHDGPRAAFAAAQRWRRRAEHPLNDPFTARACRAAVRSAEAIDRGVR